MMEEEIIKINRRFKKMIDKSVIDEFIVRASLVRLEELHISLMILQKTGIGKTVNELRRATTNDDVSMMTKNLLKKWKKLLSDPLVMTTLAKDDKSIESTVHRQSLPQKNIAQSTSSTNDVPWQTADAIRLKSRELLANALSITGIPNDSGDPVELSVRIEDAIYKEIKDTKAKYGRRIRSRIFNLRDLKNPDLRTKVLLGSITPEKLAVMTAEEMTSDTLKKEYAKFKEISHRESLLPKQTKNFKNARKRSLYFDRFRMLIGVPDDHCQTC